MVAGPLGGWSLNHSGGTALVLPAIDAGYGRTLVRVGGEHDKANGSSSVDEIAMVMTWDLTWSALNDTEFINLSAFWAKRAPRGFGPYTLVDPNINPKTGTAPGTFSVNITAWSEAVTRRGWHTVQMSMRETF